jgi:hypothetical protein
MNPWTREYAYEAFAALATNWNRMALQRIQLVRSGYEPLTVDHPGMWSFLQNSGLITLILTQLNAQGEIVEGRNTRKAFHKRLTSPASTPWKPLGLEKPWSGANDLDRQASKIRGGSLLERQWRCLDDRYQYLHCRRTRNARLAKARRARDRRAPFGIFGLKRHRRRWKRKKQQERDAWIRGMFGGGAG